jgi:hypothetical protein
MARLLLHLPSGSTKNVNRFHLLPDKETTQDENLKWLTCVGQNRVGVSYVAQADGSRFKTITARGGANNSEVKEFLKSKYNVDCWLESFKSKEELLQLVGKKGYEYRAYWTQTFLNGCRIIPVLVNELGNTFYNLTEVFEDLGAMDDLGIICPADWQGPHLEALGLGGVTPQLFSYLSYQRLCKCCGNVSDISQPRKGPWMAFYYKGKKNFVDREYNVWKNYETTWDPEKKRFQIVRQIRPHCEIE